MSGQNETTVSGGNSQNTVDTSTATVSREFNQLLAEANAYENSKPKIIEPGTEPEVMPEVNQAAIDAAGDQVKAMLQMPLGSLLEFGGCIVADTDAPNWRLHGLTDEHIRSVAMPLGAVADKYCMKIFGVSTTELLAGHEEEAALVVSSLIIWRTFKAVPMKTPEAAAQLAAIRKQEMDEALALTGA